MTWKFETSIESMGSPGVEVTRESMTNENGVKVKAVGGDQERSKIFLYKDNTREFRFYANRYDTKGQPTDTYIVMLGEVLRNILRGNSSDILSQEYIETVKSNIDSALKEWPLPLLLRELPVRHVKFNMAFSPI